MHKCRYKCLKCGAEFTHYWRGGHPRDELAHAGTNCTICNHPYIRRVENEGNLQQTKKT
jgi:DNA-directed RNA polymerase subunit RPC12/RpoP